jgi:glycosyltransferase involved in cell wall biosynthesis
MKVLFDYQAFSMQRYGGVSRYIYEIANLMAGREGCETEIFSPLYINEYFCGEGKVKPRGIRVPRFRGAGRVAGLVDAAAARLLVRPRRDVDIYHETYFSKVDCCPSSAKRIITVYDMIHEKFGDQYPKDDPTRINKAIAVGRADHVICISEQTRRDLIELLGVDPAKISVVYLGFTLTSHGEDIQKPTFPARPFLLYVGSRIRYKNFVGLLRAYAQSSKLRNDFDLVCFGGGEFTAKELGMLQQHGVSRERIHQVAGDDAALAEYYKAASVFVYPSLYEGFGIPPLEAMSFDCPVVCGNVSSIPEVVGDAAELCEPDDPESIRMAIERVISSDTKRQDLIKSGRQRIKLFSWERCAQETLGVYHRVIS